MHDFIQYPNFTLCHLTNTNVEINHDVGGLVSIELN